MDSSVQSEGIHESAINNAPKQQRYKKIKVLGEGSMGKVYLVKSREDDLLYVMKRIYIGHLPEAEQERAKRQAQLHSMLVHPNIIAFKEIYHTTTDKLCIIMEYASEGDLQGLIRKQTRPFPEELLLRMFSQICLGLREIHEKKIIHRDLKTANIFIVQGNILKIGDFGISRALDQTVLASKSFVGTPYYLSPEMVEGKAYSTKSDIWALGVILYYMCSLKLPFEANSLSILALKILKGSFPPLANNMYSRDIKALIASMLTVDQRRRPSIHSILSKPFILKLLPKEEQQKMAQYAQKADQKTLRKTSSVQGTKIQKIKPPQKKNEQTEAEQKYKEKQKKQQQKDKRQQMRKQMREDLHKRRKQADRDKPADQSLRIKQETLKTMKKEKSVPDMTSEVVAQQTVKPWREKKNLGDKKQISVQIFVPTIKPKEESEIQHSPPQIERKRNYSLINPPSSKTDMEIQNYHYSKHNLSGTLIEDNDESSEVSLEAEHLEEEDQIDEEIEDQIGYDVNDLIEYVAKIGKITNNLVNPYKEIDIYGESSQFDHTVDVVQDKKPEKPQPSSCQSVVTHADNLQELRQILEDSLGFQDFKKAYNIIKQQFDDLSSMPGEQKSKQQQDLIFNYEILKEKLPFLSEQQFRKNIELLYTIILIEDQQTRSNIIGEKGYLRFLS